MEKAPTHLDLFSGIGGFALAAQWAGFRTIGFCEIDKYCRKVLAKNFMADATSTQDNGERRDSEQRGSTVERNGETAQQDNGQTYHHGFNGCSPIIHKDIFDLDGRDFAGVSLITGGFPCQPFSVAGKRRGAADDRAIWPEMFRVIREARPAWVLGENVLGFVQMELDGCISDLEGIGYAVWPVLIPACAVGAFHRRTRCWIIARRNDELADPDRQGLQGRSGAQWCAWEPEPAVGRVAHGIPKRVDRLKGLGNAIVPQVAYEILREIRKLC